MDQANPEAGQLNETLIRYMAKWAADNDVREPLDEAYAKAVKASASAVSRWRNGESYPDPFHMANMLTLHRLDDPAALGFARFRPHRRKRTAEEDYRMLVDRRAALRLFSAAVEGVVPKVGWLTAGAATVAVGAGEILRASTLVEIIHVTGQTMGGGALRPETLLKQLDTLFNSLDGSFATPSQREEMAKTVAGLAAPMGFALLDQGRQIEAHSVFLTGIASLRRVRNGASAPDVATIRAHLIANLAFQAISMGRPKHALDLLSSRALADDEGYLSEDQLCWLASLRAEAYAAFGDYDETLFWIKRAERLFTERDRSRIWNYGGWFDEGEFLQRMGRAFAVLMLHFDHHRQLRDDALAHLEASAQKLAPTLVRTQARGKIVVATIYAATGDYDGMLAAASGAVDAARGLHSTRVQNELRQLDTAMAAFPSQQVQQFRRERLAAVCG